MTTTNTADVVFDATIHATDADGNPVMRKDGTFALKRGRKPGSTVTTTRKGFDVTAVSAAYLARVMAAGDVAELTRFSLLKPAEKIAFLTDTPEYAETVTAKTIRDAVAAIDAILNAAGDDLYPEIMEMVRFGH